MITTLVIVTLLVLIIINVIASIYIGNAPAYETSQKTIQIILIWLIPYFGAFFFGGFMWFERNENKNTKRQIGNATNITNSEAVDHAISTDHYGND